MDFTYRFFIDEEKKIVICKLENCHDSVICDMCRKGYPGHEKMLIDYEFTGKAKCSPEDTFDVEVGKKIAYKRAIAKMAKAQKRVLTDFVEGNKKFVEELARDSAKLINKYDATISRKDQEIAYILGEHAK